MGEMPIVIVLKGTPSVHALNDVTCVSHTSLGIGWEAIPILQVPTTQLANMTIDAKFVELTGDVLDFVFLNRTLAKLSFNHPLGVLSADVFYFFFKYHSRSVSSFQLLLSPPARDPDRVPNQSGVHLLDIFRLNSRLKTRLCSRPFSRDYVPERFSSRFLTDFPTYYRPVP